MALTPEEEAGAQRLADVYNERPYDAQANPGGFGRGGNSAIGLFIAACRDIANFGRGVVRTVSGAVADVERMYGEMQIVAGIVEGGPVYSVQVGDSAPQTGAVKIDLGTVSAQVNAELAKVQTAQAQLAATQAGIQSNAIAYANAFGG